MDRSVSSMGSSAIGWICLLKVVVVIDPSMLIRQLDDDDDPPMLGELDD